MTTSSKPRRAFRRAAVPAERHWHVARIVGWGVAVAVCVAFWTAAAVWLVHAL